MSSAARQKRLRARQRNGEVVVPVEVTNDIVATLMDLGWLAASEGEDRKHIGWAIRELLNDLAVSHKQKIP